MFLACNIKPVPLKKIERFDLSGFSPIHLLKYSIFTVCVLPFFFFKLPNLQKYVYSMHKRFQTFWLLTYPSCANNNRVLAARPNRCREVYSRIFPRGRSSPDSRSAHAKIERGNRHQDGWTFVKSTPRANAASRSLSIFILHTGVPGRSILAPIFGYGVIHGALGREKRSNSLLSS
jgi:hypothetical protein